MRPVTSTLALWLSAWLVWACQPPQLTALRERPPTATIPQLRFAANGLVLRLELLDDDLVHFELARAGHESSGALPLSPMLVARHFAGPSRLHQGPRGVLETAALRLRIDPARLAWSVVDLRRGGPPLTELSPLRGRGLEGLQLAAGTSNQLYGLGAQFTVPGSPDGQWLDRRRGMRTPGNEFGNAMTSFSGGNVINAQFPVLYAVGPGHRNYALFLDAAEAQRWDFRAAAWEVRLPADSLRGFLLGGADLPALRASYMELVGRPLVPPKKMFGLWVSEYGYRDWNAIEDKLASLRQRGFPVDGFVLDAYWFGGFTEKSSQSRVGSLQWDRDKFPVPERRLRELGRQGIGIMAIEESYVSQGLPEFPLLEQAGYLVRQGADGPPVTFSTWWGAGGMLDWTSETSADFWHDLKRAPLIRAGILGHWTDLGEPEDYRAGAWYAGSPGHDHARAANLYNFKWLQSIYRGYQRHHTIQRPFMLSRSGAPGIQRFGAAMWSGDIGSNLASLQAHLNVQLHLSLSGIDYFGADIGGFKRESLDGDLGELYTQWFANGAAMDLPVRPHTDNTEQRHETAPDRVGELRSNLFSIRLRYQLSPYLYSLAHLAHREGQPLFPPPVYYYQEDASLRGVGSQKMIGRDLMVATVGRYGATTRDVYLPAGTWVNYYSGEWVRSAGQWLRAVPLRRDGQLVLPLFAKAGAIIPEMYVDDATLNIEGLRRDGSRRDELRVRVFADDQPSSFMLFEDDGRTNAYLQGAVRTTRITQQRVRERISITRHPAAGTYAGAIENRSDVVILVLERGEVDTVLLNGAPLGRQRCATTAAGWCGPLPGRVYLARAPSSSVRATQRFAFQLKPGRTQRTGRAQRNGNFSGAELD